MRQGWSFKAELWVRESRLGFLFVLQHPSLLAGAHLTKGMGFQQPTDLLEFVSALKPY
jgi:hypothetical protein